MRATPNTTAGADGSEIRLALERDAARYRALRENMLQTECMGRYWWTTTSGQTRFRTLDDYADALIAQESEARP